MDLMGIDEILKKYCGDGENLILFYPTPLYPSYNDGTLIYVLEDRKTRILSIFYPLHKRLRLTRALLGKGKVLEENKSVKFSKDENIKKHIKKLGEYL